MITDRSVLPLITERSICRYIYIYIYIYIYTPKISNRFVHVWNINTCFEIASENVYPQIKFLATVWE